MLPPLVMAVPPLLAVALEKLSAPWLGALFWLQVRVWLASVSLACSKPAMPAAPSFSVTDNVVVDPMKVGETLGKPILASTMSSIAR